ncbi:PAS domain S-box protein [Spirosoma flavus]
MTPRLSEGDRITNRPPLAPKTVLLTGTPSERSTPPHQDRWSSPTSDLDKIIDNLLLNQYVPASVVVNQDLEILQFRGSTGLFLEPSPGKASLNLIKMARPSLVFELRNAVHKVQKSGESVRKSGLEVKIKNKVHYVAIEAIPIDTVGEERLFLIIFEEVEPPVVPTTRSADARNRRIKELESELANLREDMRSIIEEQEASNEELQSANEEIISSNEELQSINEELETSKEEIESTNEELLTINQELQVRNDQLSEAYQFAEDIFGTIREATLVLDADLRVKSANQAFYRLFRISEGETERRLIYELDNRQWDIPELRLMLTDIITSGVQFQGFEMTYKSFDADEKILSLNARRVVRQQSSILLAIDDISEHRRAQRLLAEREAWFHQIADNVPTLIWVTDASGRFTFLNKVWSQFTGRTIEDVQMHGVISSLHPEDRPTYQSSFESGTKAQHGFNAEYRLRGYEGDYRWMLEHAQPVYGPDGQFNGYIGSSADVHMQKEMNQELDWRVQERTQELEKSLDLFQAVINAAPISIVVMKNAYGVDGSIEDFEMLISNAFNTRTIGDRDVIGTRFSESFPTTLSNNVLDRFKHVATTGESADFELWYDGDNMHHWFHFKAYKLDELLVVITEDVTNRRINEVQIQQTAEYLQAVLDSSITSICFLKPVRNEQGEIADFNIAVCNKLFAQNLNLPIQQLFGQSVLKIADKLWHQETLTNLRQVLETNESFYEEWYSPDNAQWMLHTLVKYDDGVVLTGQNITALKTAEERQENLLNELENSNENIQLLTQLRVQIRERGEFLRSTSHDLRGNFGIIQGAASLLDLANSDEERSQMLSMLNRNLRQATQMLTELLDVARLESGQEKRNLATVDVARLVSEIIESARPLANQRGLWLRAEGDESLLVETDPVKLQRIAQNLILNGLTYTQTGGVTVRWEDFTDTWQLTIEDTGDGLPESGHTKSGEGIGLVIVRQLCDLLECQQEVDSSPETGTRFQLSFPKKY